MSSKLNKKELKKMLSELNAELKSVTNEAKHFKEKRRTIRLRYEEEKHSIISSIHDLDVKKSLINSNINKLKSLISASDKI
jgi:hypothetical protein